MKNIKEQFRRYLRLQKGLSPNTLEAYLHDVSLLFSWVAEKGSKVEGQRSNVCEDAAIDDRIKQLKLADLEEFSASLFDLASLLPHMPAYFVASGLCTDSSK